MPDISITERFGAEPLRCDDCGVEHPDHSPYCHKSGPGRALIEAQRERDAARQAADEQTIAAREARLDAEQAKAQAALAIDAAKDAARAAQRDACLRGFAIVRAAFEAWRDGDKGVPTDDTDVFLALQATHLGFQALARALDKKCERRHSGC